MPVRIGNRSYPSPVLSDQQRGVMTDLLNDPRWQKFQIGNRTYVDDTVGQAPPPSAPVQNKITGALHGYAAGLGKSANDLTQDEMNQFLQQWGGSTPPAQLYKLPRNY